MMTMMTTTTTMMMMTHALDPTMHRAPGATTSRANCSCRAMGVPRSWQSWQVDRLGGDQVGFQLLKGPPVAVSSATVAQTLNLVSAGATLSCDTITHQTHTHTLVALDDHTALWRAADGLTSALLGGGTSTCHSHGQCGHGLNSSRRCHFTAVWAPDLLGRLAPFALMNLAFVRGASYQPNQRH